MYSCDKKLCLQCSEIQKYNYLTQIWNSTYQKIYKINKSGCQTHYLILYYRSPIKKSLEEITWKKIANSRLNSWYLFPPNVYIEKFTKFYKSISLFWAKYYSHQSYLGDLVDFLMFTPFLAIYSARIMTNLEETKMLKIR